MSHSLTILIPAYNEGDGIVPTLERIKAMALKEHWDVEMIVIDDGSSDDTGKKASANGATVLRNPVNSGYGSSLRRGIAGAKYELIAITDADGTYPIESLPALLAMMDDGFDMAIGARQGSEYRKGMWKYPARVVFRWLAEYVAGRSIPDINSGLRVFRRHTLLPHLRYTCLGFSFTTSITLIYFLTGYFVGYHPIPYAARVGSSKIRHLRDTLRTTQIMVSVIAHYNPLKLFLLIALMSSGLGLLLLILHVWVPFQACIVLGSVLIGISPLLFALGCQTEARRRSGGEAYDQPSP